MTVRVLDYRGDGAYFLADPAHELDGLRQGGPGRVLAGDADASVDDALRRTLSVARPDGRRALDVIVAAPKPVSVLLALDAPDVAREVVTLHERSVADALAYLRDEALETGPTLRAVGFTHGVNRLLDPHLHTHVVLSVHDEHGVAYRAPLLRAHAATADALYLSTLRAGLPRVAGRSSWMTTGGRMHVDGVDLGLLAALSSPRDRRGRIERGGVKTHPSAAAVRAHWDRVVERTDPIGHVTERPASTGALEEYRFAAGLGEGLVGRPQLVRAWATACQFGQDAGQLLASVTLLAPGLTGTERQAGIALRDDVGVHALGPRPIEPGELSAWLTGRAALDRHLAAGYPLSHVRNHRGASAPERLSLARLDAALADARSPSRTVYGVGRGRSIN